MQKFIPYSEYIHIPEHSSNRPHFALYEGTFIARIKTESKSPQKRSMYKACVNGITYDNCHNKFIHILSGPAFTARLQSITAAYSYLVPPMGIGG